MPRRVLGDIKNQIEYKSPEKQTKSENSESSQVEESKSSSSRFKKTELKGGDIYCKGRQVDALGDKASEIQELTLTSVEKLIDLIQNKMGVLPVNYYYEQKELDKMKLSDESVFLDIGCGLGKVVLLVGNEIKCRAHGIEADQDCLEKCIRLHEVLKEMYDVSDDWDSRVTFANLPLNGVSTLSVDGQDPSHIFLFGRNFSDE